MSELLEQIFSGKYGGIAIMLTGFLGSFWVFLFIALVMCFAPVIYSYLLHRKGL